MLSKNMFSGVRATLLHEITEFDHRLTRLESERYPTNSALNVIAALRLRTAEFKDRLDGLVHMYDVDSHLAMDSLISLRETFNLTVDHLVSLEGAATSRVPWSVIPWFERLAQPLFDADLLTACHPSASYRILSLDREDDDEGRDIKILQMPLVARMNVFQHFIVVHELYHPIAPQFTEKFSPIEMFTRIFEKQTEIMGYRNSMIASDSKERRARRVLDLADRALAVWKGAMHEIICDMGCVRLLGPAGFFSLASFALENHLDAMSVEANHPPWRYRLRQMFRFGMTHDHMRPLFETLHSDPSTTGLVDVLERELDGYRQLVEEAGDDDEIRESLVREAAFQVIERHLAPAWDFVCEKTNNSPHDWRRCIRDVGPLVKALRIPAPPCETPTGDAAAFAAVANAAWLFRLDGFKPATGEPLDFHTVCRMVLKGLEFSDLKTKYAAME